MTVQTKKYLLTGGAGFIGSHLADALLAQGHRVTVLDNLSTGSEKNLLEAAQHPGFTLVRGSVLDELMVDELVHACDVVVHLAAAVGVQLVIEQPLHSFTTNIRGSEIVIEAAHRYRRKIMMVSTSEIYGKNGRLPLSEDSDRVLGSPAVSRWAYSTAKAVDEILANAYHRERGLPTVTVRLFNTVGPRQSGAYGMVIPRLVQQAVRGEQLTVHGDGSQSRCFAHVADVVDAFLLLLDSEEAIGQVFNVGTQQEISIIRLAEQIVRMTGSPSEIRLVPYADAYAPGFEDMQRRIPDTTRLATVTGWHARWDLTRILTDVIEEARETQLTDQEALTLSTRGLG
ncbi:NAD-dependent epimerase/dehydratase family protein [Streptomyces antimycoticus]|uniref:NAD-dependent epimerase/dehydratase family protein n=1 Tax=Streptomyces antimycoticus TaxID=68175 RepID=UPI000A38F7A4|nr:NAD-dependent epimerase/dehydratase family protein [Streptomyces antimycoticus]